MKNFKRSLAVALLVVIAYLLFAPTHNEPVSWDAPPAPILTVDPYAEHRRSVSFAQIPDPHNPDARRETLNGPETILPEKSGTLLTGLKDGRLVRMSVDGDHVETLASTDGRPLGLAFRPDGGLIIADAVRGLLSFDPATKKIDVLTASAAGKPIMLANSVATSSDGRYAYFTDSSTKWTIAHVQQAVMEHGGDGRLLRYDFSTQATDVLLDGLQFANGVALSSDEDFILVAETGAYRIMRYWLKGERMGRHDLFIDNLPGLPDNLSFNGKDRFWVAFYAPRDPLLDFASNKPFLRKMMARALQIIPAPTKKHGIAVALSPQGDIVATLEGDALNDYAPLTHAVEMSGWLIFGSSDEKTAARLLLSGAIPK